MCIPQGQARHVPADSHVQALAGSHRGDAGAEAEVGGGTVRNAQASLGELGTLALIQHAAVCEPAVVRIPPDLPATPSVFIGNMIW